MTNMMRPVGFPLLLLLAIKCGVLFMTSESLLHGDGMYLTFFPLVSFPHFSKFSSFLSSLDESLGLFVLDSRIRDYFGLIMFWVI